MTRSEIWSLIKDRTSTYPIGKQVTTALLGDVRSFVHEGKVVSIIPEYLRDDARQHGFRIVGASVEYGTYTLEKLYSRLRHLGNV